MLITELYLNKKISHMTFISLQKNDDIQRSNHQPYIEEGQIIIQWQKEKGKKDKQ
jgi:hypothetical protein